MEVLPKEKRKKKGPVLNVHSSLSIAKSFPHEPVIFSMKPEQEKMILRELLGNFSDQTGACFG
jgi:hypothetical protein